MEKISILFLGLLYVLVGCNNNSVDSPLYKGKHLIVGVIGDPPKVREENVGFKKIDFGQLKYINSHFRSDFNAVFIMKANLSEASKREFAKVYKTAGIPFFFMESKKNYHPFIDEEMSYEQAPDMKTPIYAIGYFQRGGEGQYWEYGLYNDIVNTKNIEDVYTRIFATIASIEPNGK